MPTNKSSATTTKKKTATKRTAAKKSTTRKPAVKPSASPIAAEAPQAQNADRLSEVARTIGSTVGGIVAKTKKALKRDSGTET